MKYFAKWLPVDGEIRSGDHFWDIYPNGYKDLSLLAGGDNSPLKQPPGRNYQKVQLFLCSRDIHEGDRMECHVEIGEPPHTIARGICVRYISENHTYTFKDDRPEYGNSNVGASYCYKVIGPISPNATWVVEGMELTDDDIEKGGGHILFWDGNIMSHWSKQKDDVFKYIKLKCPSCYTHH